MKIAILDDDRLQVKSLQKLILSINSSSIISTYENPIEAIGALKKELPDLIFLDIYMPLMDGWQFLDALKLEYADIEKKVLVYIVTSTAKVSEQEAKNYPIVKEVIKKPISLSKLKELLGN